MIANKLQNCNDAGTHSWIKSQLAMDQSSRAIRIIRGFTVTYSNMYYGLKTVYPQFILQIIPDHPSVATVLPRFANV